MFAEKTEPIDLGLRMMSKVVENFSTNLIFDEKLHFFRRKKARRASLNIVVDHVNFALRDRDRAFFASSACFKFLRRYIF